MFENYVGSENRNVVIAQPDEYLSFPKTNQKKYNDNHLKSVVKVINRTERNGLVPAILEGIISSIGDYVLVMDADFSHPPEIIPRIIKS